MKLAVYTAIFGNYDKLKELPFKTSEIKYICFTDNKKLKSKTWEINYMDSSIESPIILNRKLKINVLDYLKEYDKSIYIDGNINVLSDLKPLFNLLEDSALGAIKHRDRDCIYTEANECLRIGKAVGNKILDQVNNYRINGFPNNYGMTENCILIRNHKHKDINKIQQFWWEEFSNGIKRDQISLPYIKWKNNFDIKSINFDPRVPNPYLRWFQHNNKYKGLKKIKYKIKSFNDKKWREQLKNV